MATGPKSSKGSPAASHSRENARIARTGKSDGTSVSQGKSRKATVSGAVPSSVSAKRSGKPASPAVKRAGVTTARGPGVYPAPTLNRRKAVSSPVTDGKYGTAKAKNTARSNSDHGSAVSGLDRSWGTAPAKNQGDRSKPYGA